MTARVPFFLAVCLALIAPVFGADASWRAARVPLPASGLALAAGLEPSVERWRLVHEVARRSYVVEGDAFAAERRTDAVRAVLLTPAAPSEDVLVPLPLPDAWWSEVLDQKLDTDGVVRAVLSTRRAALLYRALVQLEPQTLGFFEQHPELARFAVERRSELFMVTAPSLSVVGGHIELPGGGEAEAAWEDVVGASAAEPERFLRRLLEREDGRLAFLVHVVHQLDPARQRFALGLEAADPKTRRERLAALASAFSQERPWWQRGRYTTTRPTVDLAAVLSRVSVSDRGVLAAPAARGFWEAVFSGQPPSADAAMQDAPADAGWLAGEIALQPLQRARARYRQLSFGQRVFAGIGTGAAPAAVEVLQGLARRPALVLVAERLGAREPAVYLDLIRAAAAVEAVEGRARRQRSLAQFECALALVDAAHHQGTLETSVALSLARDLARLPIGSDGYEDGVFAGWLEQRLLNVLRAAVSPAGAALSAEDVVLRAIAGARPRAEARVFDWEGLATRADPGLGAYRQLRRVRLRQGGPSLDEALAFSRLVWSEGGPKRNASLAAIRFDPASAYGLEDGTELPAALADAREGRPRRLAEIVDALLAGTLVALVYAPQLGPAEGAALAAAHVAQRHELGEAPFALAEEASEAGAPWRARGALLGLETALARQGLRRVTAELPPGPPGLHVKALAGFARSVALRSPATFSDDDAVPIAAAVERGRARVARLAEAQADLEPVTREAALDAWRAHALRWLVVHQPGALAGFFTLPELMRLGGGELPHDGWGLPQLAFGGGLLLRRPAPGLLEQARGQDHDEVAPALDEEPVVKIAVELAARDLPACLAPSLLGLLTQTIADEAPAVAVEDPLALSAFLRSLPRERWDDLISALAGNGPLVPATQPVGPAKDGGR